MPGLKGNANDIGSFFIKCPKCESADEFKIFYTNVAISFKIVSAFPFHKRFATVCPGCHTLFYIDEEKGKQYLAHRNVSITSFDLKEKP